MTRSASRSLQQGVILWLAFCIVIIGTAVIDASRLPLLFIPLSSWLACYGAGMGLDWAISDPHHEQAPMLGRITRRMSTGLALLSGSALLAGIAGVFWMTGLVVVAALAIVLWNQAASFRLTPKPEWKQALHRSDIVSGILFGLVGLIAWLWATTPPTFYDELAYHLVIPERTLATNSLPTYPWVFFTLMPHASDIWLAWGMFFAGSLGARAMHWGIWIACFIAAWSLVDRLSPEQNRHLGLPFLLLALAGSSTWWWLGTLSFAETGLTFFILSAIVVLSQSPQAPRSFIPLGLALGMTGSVKLSGLGWAAALLAAALVLRWPWKRLLGAGVVMTLFMAPWWIRAYLVTGDPVYPLAYKLFQTPLWNDQSQALLSGDLHPTAQNLGFWGTFQLPLDLLLHPERHGSASEVGVLAILSVGLVLMLPALIRYWSGDRDHRLLGYAAVTFTLMSGCLWIATSTTTRFFAPTFVFSTIAFIIMLLYAPRPALRLAGILLIPLAGWGTWQFLTTQDHAFSSTKVALGQEARETFLRRTLPYYEAAQFVATTVPPDSRLLFIGEARPYYFSRNTLSPYPFHDHPLAQWVESSPTAEALVHRLTMEGITHVVLNIPEFRRLHAQYHVLQFTGLQAEAHERQLHNLPRTLREQFARNGVHIFEVPRSP